MNQIQPSSQERLVTAIGDAWIIDGNFIRSEATNQVYGLSNGMCEIVAGAQHSIRMAERLRIIESAPVSPTNQHFLIRDMEHPEWSHMVDLEFPRFEWGKRQPIDRPGYALIAQTSDPRFAIQCFLADTGSDAFTGKGKFISHFYDDARKEYVVADVSDSFREAAEVLEGPLIGIHRNAPMITFSSPEFVSIDAGPALGVQGLYAEVQIRRDPSKGSNYDVCLMDESGNCLSRGIMGFNDLLEFKSDTNLLSRLLDDGEGHTAKQNRFEKTVLFQPESAIEVQQRLQSMRKNATLRIMTADKNFEMLIMAQPIDTARLTDGTLIHRGKGIPKRTLAEHAGKEITVGLELTHNVITKHVRGGLYSVTKEARLNADRIYRLLSDIDFMPDALVDARNKSGRFPEVERVGDRPGFHHMLAVACEGKVDEIVYLNSKTMNADELIIKQPTGGFEP